MKEEFGENDYLQAFGEKRGKKNCCLKSDLRRGSEASQGDVQYKLIRRCGEAFWCTTCFAQVI